MSTNHNRCAATGHNTKSTQYLQNFHTLSEDCQCALGTRKVIELQVQGREDLHLDERLMQMLQSANAALQADELAAYRSLHARTFAVIPLGPKTGLIEWVDHSMPLFGVYRAWQRRTARPAGDPRGASRQLQTSVHLYGGMRVHELLRAAL